MQCRRDAGTVTASNRYNNSYTYADLRGNISNLQRNGLYLNGACFTQALVDNMTYSYTAGTNKISSIADAGNTTQGGFRASTGAMTYDANGNMISNVAKGITSISYNYLNLPTNITITGGKTIDFTYDAIGIKLRKVVKTGATINLVQEYLNGIEYRGSAIPATTIEGIYHTEGRLYNNAGWKREYTIKDHLGNTRVAYCDLNSDGVVATPSEILQENSYDPFGYELSGVYMNHANADNLYLYNGKEKNDDHGLGMYDYGARWYDPGVGRWTTVDPFSDFAPNLTPYRYGFNNPILYKDPDGYFESRSEAREYKKDHNLRGSVRRQDDGSFAIESSKDHSFTYRDKELGVMTGALVEARGVHLRDIGMEGLRNLGDPFSQSFNPNGVVQIDMLDRAYFFGSQLGLAMPTARYVSAGVQVATTTEKLVIQFGNNANQTYHAFRYIERLGLDKGEVMAAIKNHLPSVISKLQEGKPLNEVISIGGKEIQYTAFKLSDGTINVGRIHGATKP